MSRKRPGRILFVCYADSTHAQGWMSFLADTEFEVRVFTTYTDASHIYRPADWRFPSYTLTRPRQDRHAPRVFPLLPVKLPYAIVSRLDRRLGLSERWLRRIVLGWRPDVLHTLRLGLEGALSWRVLRTIPPTRRPAWLVNSWGSDVTWCIHLPREREMVLAILRDCDGFSADCQHVLDVAVANGLDEAKIIPGSPIPGPGGIDLESFARRRGVVPPARRKVIVIPKAVEGSAQQTFSLLEGLRLALDVLGSADIRLLMCSLDVQDMLYNMPEELRTRCTWSQFLPQREFLDLLLRARVMMAPTLTDGTPNVMLEAMAGGALPILAPLPSIEEWIEDGRNGLLAGALYPHQVARAVRRAMTDDALCERASRSNWSILKARADRAIISPLVQSYYRHAVSRSRLI